MKRTAAALAGVLTAMAIFGATADAASVTPFSKDFDGQAVGTSSAFADFTLYSTDTSCVDPPMCFGGFVTYTVDTSALGGGPGTTTTAGDFAIHNVDCTYPQATSPPSWDVPYYCQFQVAFAPTAGGTRARTLSFPETPAGSDGSLSLIGAGIAPAPSPTATATGLRTTAIKHCKRKFPKGSAKRKKCLRHARKLPV